MCVFLTPLLLLMQITVNIKKRAYARRVREVEHAIFTPLVMSASGGFAHFKHTLLNIFKQAVGPGVLQTFSTCAVKH